MSIATYSELQTAVATWLARSNLTSYIPDLIALGEQRIFRGSDDPLFPSEALRVAEMETEGDLTLSAELVAQPTGFLEAKRLFINDATDNTPLDVVSSSSLLTNYPLQTNGRPKQYAVEGSNFRFRPIPDSSYAAKLLYYKKPDPLATTATNAVLTALPGAYLYATLLEAQPFIRNDERLAVWARLYAAAIGGVMKSNKASRWSGVGRVNIG